MAISAAGSQRVRDQKEASLAFTLLPAVGHRTESRSAGRICRPGSSVIRSESTVEQHCRDLVLFEALQMAGHSGVESCVFSWSWAFARKEECKRHREAHETPFETHTAVPACHVLVAVHPNPFASRFSVTFERCHFATSEAHLELCGVCVVSGLRIPLVWSEAPQKSRAQWLRDDRSRGKVPQK